MDIHVEPTPRKMKACRICHDSDEDSNMEIPCSCRGTLKVCCANCFTHLLCMSHLLHSRNSACCSHSRGIFILEVAHMYHKYNTLKMC